jgi:hypothetical protein
MATIATFKSTRVCFELGAAFGLLALVSGCGGSSGGGGGGTAPPPPEGTPVLCQGTLTNSQTGATQVFPCLRNGDGCEAVPENDRPSIGCGVEVTMGADGKIHTQVPGLERANLEEGFCACKTSDIPIDQQPGTCQSVCDEVVLKAKNLNNGDPNGPWSCSATNVPGGEKAGTCNHGSVVYLTGGPSDYTAQLVGSQTTGGSVDLVVTTVERHATSDVDGWMEFSVGDRSAGCGAAGCAFTVNLLGLRLEPFEIEGFTVEDPIFGTDLFTFDGLSVDDAYIVNQGSLEGVIFDDGKFQLPSGTGKLIVDIDTGGSARTRMSRDLGQTIRGTVDFASGGVSFEPFSFSDEDGTLKVNDLFGGVVAAPPKPQIATAADFECTSPNGTPVTLDASGTTEPDGEKVTFSWRVDGQFVGTGATRAQTLPLGTSMLHLEARDSRLSAGYASKDVIVADRTPPVFVPPGDADLTSCDAQVDRLALTPPVVTDSCTGVESLDALLLVKNGVTLNPPQPIDFAAAPLGGGDHVVQWIARDVAGNESSVTQTLRVGPAIQATDHLELRDRTRVRNTSGVLAAVASIGTGQSQLGVEGQVGELLSIGSVFMQNNSKIIGRGATQGTITRQQGATVGLLQEHTTLNLGNIPWLASVAGTSFGGSDVTVPPDSTRVLTGSSYGRVQVNSRSSLTLPASVAIRELWLEPQSTLILPANAKLVVRDKWINRGRVISTAASAQGQVFVLGDQLLLERPVSGLALVAPNARVTLTSTAHGTRASLVVGKVVEVQPDVTLYCDRAATIPPN